MDLKVRQRIASALLPFEYREHVLGDLEERGFRLRDVVSIFPRVWFSHLQRDPTLWFHLIGLVTAGASVAAIAKMPYGVAAVFVSLLALLGMYVRGVKSPHNLEDRRKYLHRQQELARVLNQVIYCPLGTNITSYLWPSATQSQRFVVGIAMFLVMVYLARICRDRIDRELKKLPLPSEPKTIFGNSMI